MDMDFALFAALRASKFSKRQQLRVSYGNRKRLFSLNSVISSIAATRHPGQAPEDRGWVAYVNHFGTCYQSLLRLVRGRGGRRDPSVAVGLEQPMHNRDDAAEHVRLP